MVSIIDEYRTIISRAGWIDRSNRGRIRLDGADAGTFLQALLTNDVLRLQRGEGCHAAYLTPQGRMLADLEIYRRADALLADVTPGAASALAVRLDTLVFSEDVRITDVSDAIAEFSVVGQAAPACLADAFALDPDRLRSLTDLSQAEAGQGFVARSTEVRAPAFKLFVPASDRTDVVGRLSAAGVVPLSDALFDAMCVEAGRPRFGIDMTEDTIPLEAGLLERSISTSKGCYVGQEVIIRVLHRGGGRVARRLVTLDIDLPSGQPASGAALEVEGREVGRVTSTAVSPTRGSLIALGYLHRDVAEIGRRVTVAGSGAPAIVTGFAA